MNITQEQALQIHDLTSYSEVTGAKRFKRTKVEMEAGYSPEEALQRRLDEFRGTELPAGATGSVDHAIGEEPVRRTVKITETSKKSAKSGDITIRPMKGVSPDYFEHIPSSPIEVRLDAQWYGWFDTLVNGPYEGNVQKLIQHIFDLGIGETLTRFHFPADIEEFERPVRSPGV